VRIDYSSEYGTRGFTLIELIIVIIILGVLAAYAIPKFADITSEARKSIIHTTYGEIATLLKTVKLKCQVSPDCDPEAATVTLTDYGNHNLPKGILISYGELYSRNINGWYGLNDLYRPDKLERAVDANWVDYRFPGTTNCRVYYRAKSIHGPSELYMRDSDC